jgi:hypothetical protein
MIFMEIVISVGKEKEKALSTCRNRGSSVGIATSYDLDGWVSIPGRGKRFFSSPQQPDRLWSPPNQSNG